jgi:hypothetical protein
MTQDPIIEKLKKLLRMKRGGTPGEIANALAMAAELARKHGIDLDAIDPDAPEAKPIGHMDAMTSARLQDECRYAALVCENFFNVKALITNAPARTCYRWRDFKIVFIGTASDQQIAIYIFRFLVGHFRRSWNHRENKRIRHRHSFMDGIFQGLCRKLQDQRVQEVSGSGLIRLDQQLIRRNEYMQKTFGETKKEGFKDNSDSAVAKYAGYVVGRKTEIRSSLS